MESANWYKHWLIQSSTEAQSPILLSTSPVADITELIPEEALADVELVSFPIEGKISISTTRDVLSQLDTAPMKSVRLVWIPQAERLPVAAANTILKTLEEASLGNRFLLTTAYVGRILPTIRSRCTTIRLPRTPDEVTDVSLPKFDAKRKQELTTEEAKAIAAYLQKHIHEKGMTPDTLRTMQRLRDYYKISSLTSSGKLASDALLATLLTD